MDRGVPSLDWRLTTRSDRRLRGGHQPGIFGSRQVRQEAVVYRDERCPIFRQLGDQELIKTVLIKLKIIFKTNAVLTKMVGPPFTHKLLISTQK